MSFLRIIRLYPKKKQKIIKKLNKSVKKFRKSIDSSALMCYHSKALKRMKLYQEEFYEFN